MKKTTTKEEFQDTTKGITEMRMTLGHLCVLQASLAEHSRMGEFKGLSEMIKSLTDSIQKSCQELISSKSEE